MNGYKIATEIDRIKWSEFVYNHLNGNIFQVPELHEVYQKIINYGPVLLAVVNSLGQYQEHIGGYSKISGILQIERRFHLLSCRWLALRSHLESPPSTSPVNFISE